MNSFLLEGLGVIRINGPDRVAFLQGQLTQDLEQVTVARSKLWGWNNPKGRLLAIGQAVATDDALLLVLPKELVEATVKRLQMFVLRAEVTVSATQLVVAGMFSGPGATSAAGLELGAGADACTTGGDRSLTRLCGDPARALLIGPDTELGAERDAEEGHGWELADVRAGLPRICSATAEAFVPQMVNLDLVGGISFTKGCYVGQEVVARTQNLGRIKRRMFRFASPAPADAGNAVVDEDGGKVGQVVRCAPAEEGHELLAVVQLSALDTALFVGDALLQRLPLPYAVPETA